jgi:hypothetical protein
MRECLDAEVVRIPRSQSAAGVVRHPARSRAGAACARRPELQTMFAAGLPQLHPHEAQPPPTPDTATGGDSPLDSPCWSRHGALFWPARVGKCATPVRAAGAASAAEDYRRDL